MTETGIADKPGSHPVPWLWVLASAAGFVVSLALSLGAAPAGVTAVAVVGCGSAIAVGAAIFLACSVNRARQRRLDELLACQETYGEEAEQARAAYRCFSGTLMATGGASHLAISVLNLIYPAPLVAASFWAVATLILFMGFPTAWRAHMFVMGARARKLHGDV